MHHFIKNLGINAAKGIDVTIISIDSWCRVIPILQMFSDKKMIELNSNFKDRLFINLHEHVDISESNAAGFYDLVFANCLYFKPLELIFEELAIKHDNLSC